MAEYRVRATGEIIDNPQAYFPNSSLPAVLNAEACDVLGIDIVYEGVKPALTSRFQSLGRDGIEKIGDKWFTKYVLSDWSLEAISAATEMQAVDMRRERNFRLSQTDWVVTKALETGTPVPTEWQVYRQALRDISDLPGFPWDFSWPEQP